jgi:amino acid transporter
MRGAAVMTLIELAGLLLVVSAGLVPVRDFQGAALVLVPTDLDAWSRVCASAFLAFFACTGFENLANMAEEAKHVGRTIPRAILLSLGISTVISMTVALVVVAAVPLNAAATSAAPLLGSLHRLCGARPGGGGQWSPPPAPDARAPVLWHGTAVAAPEQSCRR